MQRLRKALFSRPLVWYMAMAMVLISSVPRNASAGLIPSQMAAEGSRQADISKVQTALESKVVSQRLSDLGFNPDEVKMKVASFSDSDLHQLASHVDQLQGGGDGSLGIVIALLVIIILVVILLQISDHKIIIK
ncbi:MAG: PA2779 family protein [Deltaproteobacteria bacterium]|nr:PA2779 family protein [Deltaproteobacteria bacterium]